MIRETEHRSCGDMFVMTPLGERARPLSADYFESVCRCGKRWTVRARLWQAVLPDCPTCAPRPAAPRVLL